METLQSILNRFSIDAKIENYGNGHINTTYLTEGKDCILQKINTNVFPDADGLMDNICRVTDFVRKKIREEGGDPERETLSVIRTREGGTFYRAKNGDCYRVYKFITDTKTIEDSTNPEDLYAAGVGFGHFGKMLADFPAESLFEVIPDFHNTPKRVEALKRAIAEDKCGRVRFASEEISFALSQENFASVATDAIFHGRIPLRVTHNDTKINNILFDNQTGRAICVIDLDTVMSGSVLYDFGDALRMGASSAAEDETDLSKVSFLPECYEAFAKGYLSEMRDSLTKEEIRLLPYSPRLLTYECGIRFLTDYLSGDTYFKIHRENHNLDRARNQLHLVRDLLQKEDELVHITQNLV